MNNRKIKEIYEKFIEEGHDIALQECMGGYPDKEDCTWYHANWMLLRYLGVVSNPYWHEPFYRKALEYVDANNKESILVAGTADFSMPLLCSEFGIKKIDICDICNTPLLICKKVSAFLAYEWSTYIHNICREFSLQYDIIINDAFLSRFTDKLAPLKGITGGLKSGGYYITTLKQGKWNSGGEVTDLVKEAFVEKVERRYDEYKSILPCVNINAVSKEYVDKMASFPVSDEEEVYRLFYAAGLKIIHLEKGLVEGEFEQSEYYRIISQKK